MYGESPQSQRGDGLWLAPMPATKPASDLTDMLPGSVTTSELIETVNNKTGGAWKAGLNDRFATLSMTDWRKELLTAPGALNLHSVERRPLSSADQTTTLTDSALPTDFDIREAHPDCTWVKTIIDQGGCGSCWAWAASGCMATRMCMATKGKINTRFSPQHIMLCNTEDELGCGGGALDNVWTFLTTASRQGVTTEECVPYGWWNPDGGGHCPAVCQDGNTTVAEAGVYHAQAGRVWTPAGKPGSAEQVQAMQTEIMTNGPLEVGIELFSDFAAYKSGVYHLTVNASYGGGHAVQIIGWGTDTDSSDDYWLVQNTYGAQWGENGYFRIRRGTNEIGIEDEVIAAPVVVPSALF